MRYALCRFASHTSLAKTTFCLALVTVLIGLILSWDCSATPDLSGDWESTIGFEPATGTWSLEADCSIEVEYADWTTSVRTVFKDGAWTKQEFEAKAQLGTVNIELDLRFEPTEYRFKDWITEFGWSMDDLALSLTAKVTQTTDWLIFEAEREWTDIEVDLSCRLRAPSGSCSLLFYDAGLDVQLAWCRIETDLEIAFDKDGFDEVVIAFSDLALARIPWLTFDLEVTKTLEATTVEFSPECVLAASWSSGHIELEFEGTFPDEPALLPLSINEAALALEIGEWEIDTTAILDPNNWIDDLYWLELEAEATFDLGPCSEVSLGLTFLWTEIDLGRVLTVLAIELADNLATAVAWDLDLDAKQLDRIGLELQIEW
ncbi:hypothetical protein ACFLSZ_02700 [Candidatus Bipolaricaulota bacterium]